MQVWIMSQTHDIDVNPSMEQNCNTIIVRPVSSGMFSFPLANRQTFKLKQTFSSTTFYLRVPAVLLVCCCCSCRVDIGQTETTRFIPSSSSVSIFFYCWKRKYCCTSGRLLGCRFKCAHSLSLFGRRKKRKRDGYGSFFLFVPVHSLLLLMLRVLYRR